VAYNAFHPSTVASSLFQAPGPAPAGADFAGLVAAQVVEQMRSAGMAVAPRDDGAAASSDEDRSLHSCIDTFRDLFKDQSEPLLAEKGLMGLLERADLSSKPLGALPDRNQPRRDRVGPRARNGGGGPVRGGPCHPA
jgi:hypothetical protein